ncbi:GNAT family N-acetyltransferase [Aestuariibius sp. 2305UL40-4]|uniref:GNAT family N-acetyltransferase n=1 Tax=Aestuariibius violaceus TaxID=3234132 RepID=UPI00345E9110
MELRDGYFDVPAGKVAAVVTYLDRALRDLSPVTSAPEGVRLCEVSKPDPDAYRRLFRRVGSEWLWASRLALSPSDLAKALSAPGVVLFVLECDGHEAGVLELKFDAESACEIAFFGLSRQAMGRGLGRWLMAQAFVRAVEGGAKRVWLHTCTLDSPGALGFYRKMGFRPYKRSVEVFDDPRLRGLLPAEAAPQIPLIGG